MECGVPSGRRPRSSAGSSATALSRLTCACSQSNADATICRQLDPSFIALAPPQPRPELVDGESHPSSAPESPRCSAASRRPGRRFRRPPTGSSPTSSHSLSLLMGVPRVQGRGGTEDAVCFATARGRIQPRKQAAKSSGRFVYIGQDDRCPRAHLRRCPLVQLHIEKRFTSLRAVGPRLCHEEGRIETPRSHDGGPRSHVALAS